MKRSRSGLFGGVLAGIANSTGISVVLLRVLFVVFFWYRWFDPGNIKWCYGFNLFPVLDVYGLNFLL